jgi:hypothetical protein
MRVNPPEARNETRERGDHMNSMKTDRSGLKKTAIVALLSAALPVLAGTALAQETGSPPAARPETVSSGHLHGPFGLGIIIGEPTGIDLKFFLTDINAIEGAVAWSLSGNNELHLQAEYLYHLYDLIKVSKGVLPLFVGIGGRFIFREDADDILGIRIPVGLAYEFEGAPFDAFIEIVPIMDLTPDTDFDLEGAIGGRFYF